MSIEKIQACGHVVMVIRDDAEEKVGNVYVPEAAQKKPNTGKILSVGALVEDKSIQPGKTAIFSKQIGTEIHIFGENITVLNAEQEQVLGVI
jgi:co-chaperonin GroES (HSP10)